MGARMKSIHGPAVSWRVGECFTVDPLCRSPKVCSLNCIYCKFGSASFVAPFRTVFVTTKEFSDELATLHPGDRMIRFYGNGEIALALNIKEMMAEARKAGFRTIALLTNSTHLHDPEVRADFMGSDIIIAKLDACSEETFVKVNRPCPGISYAQVLDGLRAMRREYRGSFRLQVMMVKENLADVECLADLCKDIGPDAVYLSSPRLASGATALTRKELVAAGNRFRKRGVNVLMQAEA